MAKTEKELKEMKEKVEESNKKLNQLSEEELEQVSGGVMLDRREDEIKNK